MVGLLDERFERTIYRPIAPGHPFLARRSNLETALCGRGGGDAEFTPAV